MSDKPSMYARYLKERTGDLLIEGEDGFATYRYLNGNTQVYIVDIFVPEEFRNNKVATKLADEIVREAKEKGCTEVIGSVVPSANNSTASLKVLLGYGMSLKSAGPDFIVFGKDI